MSQIQPQRRARRIAMSDDERDAHLAALRVCRVGTVGAQGAPHVSALWYAWDGSALWLYSIIKSQRWVNLVRDRRGFLGIATGAAHFRVGASGGEASRGPSGSSPSGCSRNATGAGAGWVTTLAMPGCAFVPANR